MKTVVAIAFATAITFDQDPKKKRVKQESMRSHLAACFQQNNYVIFAVSCNYLLIY